MTVRALDHERVALLQRERRARMTRIDYMPRDLALAVIVAKRAEQRPGSVAATHSAVIDAIVMEWARLTGQVAESRIEARGGNPQPELMQASRRCAGAYESGKARPELSHPLRAHAYNSGGDWPKWAEAWLAAGKAKEASRRVICGARRRRDGQACRAKSEPGKKRCKWHGGCSTGPRTAQGKARAVANLRQNRSPTI